MSDYARDLAGTWWHKSDNGEMTWGMAIEGAIREALAKAAEVANASDVKAGQSTYIGEAIRALGAKP